MTKEQCKKAIDETIGNGSRTGVYINGIYFNFLEWRFKFMQDGVLIGTTCEDSIGYRSLYIPYEDVIKIK